MTPDPILERLGTPYTAEDVAAEEAAAARTPIDPEMQTLADYFAGALPPDDAEAVSDRLASDEEYRAWAAPLLSVSITRPRAVSLVTAADVERLEARIQTTLTGRPGSRRIVRPPLPLHYRRLVVRALVVVALTLAALAVLRFVNPELFQPAMQEASGDVQLDPIRFGRDARILLMSGARLIWHSRPDSAGVYRLTLDGRAHVVATVKTRPQLRILTPSGEVVVTRGELEIDATDPAVTWVTMDAGVVAVRSRGTPAPATTLMPNVKTLLVYGQAPRSAVAPNP